MDSRYSDWLRRAVPTDATWRTKLSELRRVETDYGDLDEHYDEDELQSVLETLVYSADDERRGAENPSKIAINGNLRNSLSSYKSAVQKYIRFRQDVELEAARPAIVGRGADECDVEEFEQTFSLERDLQSALRSSITQLEDGLEIIDGGAERSVASGRIDILAKDGATNWVVIELKAVKASREAVAQVLAYMGDISLESVAGVRGLLVAPEFDAKAISAARMVPTLELIEYSFSFNFRPCC
ncbi:MAG: endonuclease NucS [Sphingomonadales bacterium]|nr:endonuclease NucS [Sphingomonadales bacterium]